MPGHVLAYNVESTIKVVLFTHNLLQPTQVQLKYSPKYRVLSRRLVSPCRLSFMMYFRVEGTIDFSSALGDSRELVKYQINSAGKTAF